MHHWTKFKALIINSRFRRRSYDDGRCRFYIFSSPVFLYYFTMETIVCIVNLYMSKHSSVWSTNIDGVCMRRMKKKKMCEIIAKTTNIILGFVIFEMHIRKQYSWEEDEKKKYQVVGLLFQRSFSVTYSLWAMKYWSWFELCARWNEQERENSYRLERKFIWECSAWLPIFSSTLFSFFFYLVGMNQEGEKEDLTALRKLNSSYQRNEEVKNIFWRKKKL